jgi:hypothetical protein
MVAGKYPTILFEGKKAEFLNTKSFLAFDRLHMNAEGHKRLANAVLEGLGLPFDPNWKVLPPPNKPQPKFKKILDNLAWILVFVLPWIWRRLRGKSSGDGRSAKYIDPTRWSAR